MPNVSWHCPVDRPRKKLTRYELPGNARFLTFSCYQQLPLLGEPALRDAFAAHLEAIHRHNAFRLFAWVVMPDHVHLIALPSLPDWPASRILQALKQPLARKLLAKWRADRAPVLSQLLDPSGRYRFWQRGGGYDRNIYSEMELREKIEYIHANPVRGGLVDDRLQWVWSSARWYAGDHTGPVTIDRINIIESCFPGSGA